MNKPGLLVAFEGIDGSGKSTLSKNVQALLMASHGLKVAHYIFPSHDGEVGKLIRRAFMDAALLDVRSMMYLFLADALDREPVLVRALAEHDVVILDRHTLISGWAYQLEHHDIDTLIPAQQRFRFRMPDLTVILDVEPELSRERVFKKRGQAINAIYEKDDREYTQRLRDRYLAYHLLHDNTIMLDGERRTEELAYQVAHQITKMRNEGGEK